MTDRRIESSWEPLQLSPAIDLLSRGGFQLTPEEQSRIEAAIQRDPALLESMRRDIWGTTDTVERARFDTLYLKGSEVLTIDGKNMSFMEFLTKYPEQKERSALLAKMDRPTKSAFRDWEISMEDDIINRKSEALNQKQIEDKNVDVALNQKQIEDKNVDVALNRITGSVDEKKEALNQKDENLWNLAQLAKKLMDPDGLAQFDTLRQAELQQIQSDPERSPIAQELIKQWSSIEDIQSGRLNSTIEAYIISTNEKTLTPKDPQKALEFSEVVRQMRENIWVKPTTGNIDAFAASKVLGTNRENIVSSMHQIGSTGKYDRMTWDGESRSVIFHGESGTRILDTASIPPRERIMRNWLSISRDISPVLETPEQKEKKNLQIKSDKLTSIVTKDSNSLKLSNPETIPGPMQEKNWEKIKEYNTARIAFETATNPTEKLTSLKNLREKNHELEDKRRSSITAENMADPKYAILEEELFDELYGLNQLDISLGEYVQNEAKLQKYQDIKNISVDTFDMDAQDNLSWLVENRFDRMWPNANKALQKIIDSINIDEPSSTIDLTRSMSQRDRERLTDAIQKLWGTDDVLTNGDKLPVFQQKITMTASKNPDDPNSIRGLLKKPETPSSTK
jgi:hypothetical protein